MLVDDKLAKEKLARICEGMIKNTWNSHVKNVACEELAQLIRNHPSF